MDPTYTQVYQLFQKLATTHGWTKERYQQAINEGLAAPYAPTPVVVSSPVTIVREELPSVGVIDNGNDAVAPLQNLDEEDKENVIPSIHPAVNTSVQLTSPTLLSPLKPRVMVTGRSTRRKQRVFLPTPNTDSKDQPQEQIPEEVDEHDEMNAITQAMKEVKVEDENGNSRSTIVYSTPLLSSPTILADISNHSFRGRLSFNDAVKSPASGMKPVTVLDSLSPQPGQFNSADVSLNRSMEARPSFNSPQPGQEEEDKQEDTSIEPGRDMDRDEDESQADLSIVVNKKKSHKRIIISDDDEEEETGAEELNEEDVAPSIPPEDDVVEAGNNEVEEVAPPDLPSMNSSIQNDSRGSDHLPDVPPTEPEDNDEVSHHEEPDEEEHNISCEPGLEVDHEPGSHVNDHDQHEEEGGQVESVPSTPTTESKSPSSLYQSVTKANPAKTNEFITATPELDRFVSKYKFLTEEEEKKFDAGDYSKPSTGRKPTNKRTDEISTPSKQPVQLWDYLDEREEVDEEDFRVKRSTKRKIIVISDDEDDDRQFGTEIEDIDEEDEEEEVELDFESPNYKTKTSIKKPTHTPYQTSSRHTKTPTSTVRRTKRAIDSDEENQYDSEDLDFIASEEDEEDESDSQYDSNSEEEREVWSTKKMIETPSKKKIMSHASFVRQRQALLESTYTDFNARIFGNHLPPVGSFGLIWSKNLRTTGGRCHYARVTGFAIDKIELSIKVCDDETKMRFVLAHEMCHAAVWVIDKNRTARAHGAAFKNWGRHVTRITSIAVTTYHSYQIFKPWRFQCSNDSCKMTYQRHSDSVKEGSRCGRCHGLLIKFRVNKDGTPAKERAVTGFAAYVKENYSATKLKNPTTPHRDLMKVIAESYKSEQSAKKLAFDSEMFSSNSATTPHGDELDVESQMSALNLSTTD